MDWAIVVDGSCAFAALVLPVWVVWRLPRYYLSVPIGALMFWGWFMADGLLLPSLDAEYDSIGPGLFLFFGLPVGIVYCCVVAAVCHNLRRRPKPPGTGESALSPGTGSSVPIHAVLGLAVWAGLSVLCICYPFIGRARYGPPGWAPPIFNLFACGPTFLLSATMALVNLRCMLKHSRP